MLFSMMPLTQGWFVLLCLISEATLVDEHGLHAHSRMQFSTLP